METGRLLWLATGVVLVAGCGEGATPPEPGVYRAEAAQALPGNGPGKDEDPSVLRARDGRIFVAWFSDRSGNADLWITSTVDARTWTSPVRITTSPDGDFYPSLAQGEEGTFHLAWFRWSAPFRGHIRHTTSPDGMTWSPAAEEQVTTTPEVDDWVPSLVLGPDGALLVYFVSALRGGSGPGAGSDLYLARRPRGESTWQTRLLPGLSSPVWNDHLPTVARTSRGLTLVWVRYALGPSAPWLAPKSDLFLATSTDGVSWDAPRQLTADAGDIVNLYPALSPDATGAWWVTWLSTRRGSPAVYRMPAEFVVESPGAVTSLPELPAGYSHHIVSTPTPGLELAVWVQGPEGKQDVWYRVLRR